MKSWQTYTYQKGKVSLLYKWKCSLTAPLWICNTNNCGFTRFMDRPEICRDFWKIFNHKVWQRGAKTKFLNRDNRKKKTGASTTEVYRSAMRFHFHGRCRCLLFYQSRLLLKWTFLLPEQHQMNGWTLFAVNEVNKVHIFFFLTVFSPSEMSSFIFKLSSILKLTFESRYIFI